MNLHTCLIPTVLLATLLTGCQAASPAPAQSPPAEPAQSQPAQSTQPPEAVSKNEAWPKAKDRIVDATLQDGRHFYPYALSEDAGSIVAYVPDQAGKSKQVAVFDLASGASQPIANLSDRTQITYADINRNWVVWIEDGIMGASALHWRIHVYDRQKNTDKIVLEQPKDTESDIYRMPPQLAENTFYWGESPLNYQVGFIPTVTVQKYDIPSGKNTSKTSIEGTSIRACQDTLLWTGRSKDNNSTDLDIFWNRDGKTEAITHGEFVNEFTTDGQSVAWVSTNRRNPDSAKDQANPWTIHLQDNGQKRRLFESKAQDQLTGITITPRLVAWTSVESNTVYDRKLNKLVMLEAPRTGYANKVFAKGHHLFWTTPTPNAQAIKGVTPIQIHILDTDTL